VDVADDQFGSNFFHLGEEFSCFKIAAKLSFQDRERDFDQVSFSVSGIIRFKHHLLSIETADNLIIPGTERDD